MKNQIVVVTTAHKGVFCGKLISEDVDVVVLQDAKMAVYWCPEVHGVLGLAKMGPIKGCRISPAVKEIKLLGVTSITICSKEAIENWKKEQWG